MCNPYHNNVKTIHFDNEEEFINKVLKYTCHPRFWSE